MAPMEGNEDGGAGPERLGKHPQEATQESA